MKRLLATTALLLCAGAASAQVSGAQLRQQLHMQSARQQQQQQSLEAQVQSNAAAQARVETQLRLQELEQRRALSDTSPQLQAPVVGGSRNQPTRDQAPALNAPPPITPSPTPPSDSRTRGNLPL